MCAPCVDFENDIVLIVCGDGTNNFTSHLCQIGRKNSSDILMTALTYCNPNDIKCLNAYTTELIRNKKISK